MYRVLLTQWRIFGNEKRRDERREVLTVAVMWHRWMLGGRDDRDTEIGDTKVMGWWHLILGGAQHCHLVSYCQHHRFTKDRLTNIGCLLNMSNGFISLYHYLLDHYLKQRILVKCLDDVGWQAYFVAIKKLSSSSFFLWPLYFADFLMSHSDVLTMAWMVGSSFWGWGRTEEKAWSQDDDIWWVENWDGSYVSQRSPTVSWLLFTKEKNGNVITMGESELWVNILTMASLSPEIDGHRKNLIWRSELFFMNQVLSHIIRRNETMGDRGAVTLRWSMGDYSELMTSRDVLLQTWDNFNFHCFKLSNLTSVSYWHN